ncbi:MAG: DsbA family protein [Anaerolineae bacterium]|nr:DsbA family protein [Anaerolineae bacterium]
MSNDVNNPTSKKDAKAQLRKERRRKQKQKQQLRSLMFIVIGALIIAAAFIATSNQPVTGLVEPELRAHPLVNFNAMGKDNAPVVIEEIADMQCPACLNYFESIETALLNSELIEAGLVRYVYRSAGAFLGPESATAARASYCAGDQEKFWEMHDVIYANFSNGNRGGYTTKRLVAMAELIGADGDEMQACMDSDKYADLVEEDALYAQTVGIPGTPSLVINGELYEGGMNFQEIQYHIQSILGSN